MNRGFPLILALLSLLTAGCLSQNNVIQLDGVEVNDYKGEKLSSINDFRENSIKGPQYIDEGSYVLKVTGLVETPLELSYSDVLSNKKYSKVVTLYCVEGWSVNILWEGVLVKDVIEKAKPLQNAKTIIFHAEDGYTTSFPIGYVLENDIIMAYRLNNVTLPPERGFPFQLVAESKWGYKWIKWITEIEFSDDTSYEGFWERRGYSNTGNLNESFR